MAEPIQSPYTHDLRNPDIFSYFDTLLVAFLDEGRCVVARHVKSVLCRRAREQAS
jgi:hypothetical protein